MHMEITKNNSNRCLKNLFSCPLPDGIVVSTVHDLFKFLQKLYPKAFEMEPRRCVLAAKSTQARGLKTIKKQSPEKYGNVYKMC